MTTDCSLNREEILRKKITQNTCLKNQTVQWYSIEREGKWNKKAPTKWVTHWNLSNAALQVKSYACNTSMTRTPVSLANKTERKNKCQKKTRQMPHQSLTRWSIQLSSFRNPTSNRRGLHNTEKKNLSQPYTKKYNGEVKTIHLNASAARAYYSV